MAKQKGFYYIYERYSGLIQLFLRKKTFLVMDLFKTVKVCDITIRPRAPAQFNEDIPIAKQVKRRAEKRMRCQYEIVRRSSAV